MCIYTIKTLKHGIVCLNYTLLAEENVAIEVCVSALEVRPYSWGDGSVREMFAIQVRGLEVYYPRTIKVCMCMPWWCVLAFPVLGRERQIDDWKAVLMPFIYTYIHVYTGTNANPYL